MIVKLSLKLTDVENNLNACSSTHICFSLDAGGLPAVETFVLGGLLVVLLLVTGVIGRLWLRSRRFYPAREAQLTLSNIHHISEVAS